MVPHVEVRHQEGDRPVAEIDQVATAMNQMLATSHEVARSTVEAASAADTAERETSSGHAVMQVSVDAIRDLSRHVEGLSEVMQQLLADSEATIARVTYLAGEEAEAPAGAEAVVAEPEVIKKGKAEEEAEEAKE